MKVDRVYYLVHADSPVMGVIESAIKRNEQFAQACKDLQAEFPGSQIWTWENSEVCGLEFSGEPPKGWRLCADKKYCVPDKRVKAGREWRARLESMPRGVDARRFTSMVSGALKESYEYFGDSHIAWTVFEKFNGGYVLSVPAACRVIPPGCDELKMSEYWQMKEAQQEKEREA